jgi:hypothetical protein
MLKNSSSPLTRKKTMMRSAGTKPMKMYDSVSFRRTRQSSCRLASTNRREATTTAPAIREMSPAVSSSSNSGQAPTASRSRYAASLTSTPAAIARPLKVPVIQRRIRNPRGPEPGSSGGDVGSTLVFVLQSRVTSETQ